MALYSFIVPPQFLEHYVISVELFFDDIVGDTNNSTKKYHKTFLDNSKQHSLSVPSRRSLQTPRGGGVVVYT